MQRSRWKWSLLCLAVLAGLLVWWRANEQESARKSENLAGPAAANTGGAPQTPAAVKSVAAAPKVAAADTNFPYRLSNTSQTVDQLARNDRGILLENALIDTGKPLNLAIPDSLRAPPDNGTYIVQARGPIDNGFRSVLAQAGAQFISYIPNNAELVRVSAAGAQQLAANASVQFILPYEPYYKLEPSLLKLAVETGTVPQNIELSVTVFANARAQTLAALQSMGAEVAGEQRSPFGSTLIVHPAAGTALNVTRLPGVMRVEPARERVGANDLLRVRFGAATNTTTVNNYLGLSGSNVTVNINDTGADQTHPDLAGRLVFGPGASTTDPNGHGTHVIGTILGNGTQSSSVGTNASGSVINASFRGIASGAQGFVLGVGLGTRPRAGTGGPASDADLQETAARTNVFISNNSWNYGGASTYDMSAASYDAAVRDADPETPGSQSLLYVFSAGNGGGGNDSGKGGANNTIWSPGTAKNVITVGALEQLRNITNQVVQNGLTNPVFQAGTDSSNQVANYSARGNVGTGIEGSAGRFKPDVVAPGSFVVSDKSANWNQADYFNPTNVTVNAIFNQLIDTNALAAFSLLVPENATQVTISVVSNRLSLQPFPDMPIFIRLADNPTSNIYDLKTNNTVTIDANSNPALIPGSTIFYSIGDGTNQVISVNIITAVATTNDQGTLLTVLSNMDNSLGPFYRYESGTSMAAAGVSGMLALMQEFFTQRMRMSNSPALMKALLINGARSVSGLYDLQVASAVNYQGWGLPSLSNSIPGSLTNSGGTNTTGPVQFFDQSLSNSLATGQSKTWNLHMSTNAGTQPLRVTLVWTDPPGNPAAGIKLVNDLDLIVTNTDTGDVFWGNDIPVGSAFNEPADTNITTVPPSDFVNNVENVFLQPPLGTNYSITVRAHRVNVNAVTANTTGVVQDFALVVSRGDAGGLTNAFTLSDTTIVSSNAALGVVPITSGQPLFAQRVGANSQYAPTTNGVTNQWNFYVFTNTVGATNAAFSNVAFVTFSPPNLAVPRIGTHETDNPNNGVRTEADVDLYVSTDPTLTNLNPIAVNAADKSLSRTGTEKILYPNAAPGTVYYIGVKSEDRQGAEYAFVGAVTDQPFDQTDSNGNVTLTVITPPLPAVIPTGTPAHPGAVSVLALSTSPAQVRKIIVRDTITHQEFGDLVGAFTHSQKSVVLNNHSFFVNPGDSSETFIYDDSGENDIPGSRKSDGPGTLMDFAGDTASSGVWILSMVNDSSPSDTGTIDSLQAVISPQTQSNGFNVTIPANSWHFDFVDVPDNATNLTITVNVTNGPVDLYVRRNAIPDQQHFDKFSVINPPGGVMQITIFDSPPLNPGRYFIGVFNPNAVPVNVGVSWTIGFSLTPIQPLRVESVGNEPILNDAVTFSTNHVGIASRVVSAEVGLRIDHPHEADLAITLISPSGTRCLLVENRGGFDTNGFGAGQVTTNFQAPTTSTNNGLAVTNDIDVGVNQGTLLISYDMQTVPDDLRVYYDGVRIFDSGTVSGAGTFSIDFGPGASTHVIIVMNEGNNPNNSTVWTYSAAVVTRQDFYANFTENTNLTTTPIKFAVPPFGSSAAPPPPTTNLISDFEVTATNYAGPGTNVDGWTILDTNVVTVVSVPAFAASEGNAIAGANVLALHHGDVSRVLPTIAGQNYTLRFVNHGRPDLSPISWWKAENNYNDVNGGNNGVPIATNGPVTFVPGEVSQAFNFNGGRVDVGNATNLQLQDFSIDAWIKRNNPNIASTDANGGDLFGFGQNGYTFVLEDDGTPVLSHTGIDGVSGNQKVTGTNDFYHVAVTKTGGTVTFFVNGVPFVSPTNYIPGFTFTSPAAIGQRGDGLISAFLGTIDEMDVFSNILSVVQIQDIYAAGNAGKRLPSESPIVTGTVVLDGHSNSITGSDAWTTNTINFTAASNGTTLELRSIDNGMLYDSFELVASPPPTPGTFFLPEDSLNKFVGEPSQGDWKLEIWDNRVGATNPTPTLVSWQLSLVLDRLVPAAIPLTHAIPNTNTVPANGIAYYSVDVPAWALFATNTLSTPGGPLMLWFNQNQLPGVGSNVFDQSIAVAAGGPSTTVFDTTASSPRLVPGQRYYLAVQNLTAAPTTFTIEVDFDITSLTNGIALTNTLAATGVPRYFQYDVSTNARAVAFELLSPSGDVNLVARKGPPLPDEFSFDYISARPGTNNESIVVTTNSLPVPLTTPSRWYLGVFNHAGGPVTYAIRATEFGPPNIILLTNDQRFTTNFPPGPSLDTFFQFDITQSNESALFELYNLDGNVDLNLQRGSLPYIPPYFANSANPGSNGEQIVIRTNLLGTNINASWFMSVPNNATSNVTFTIHAVVATNGILISAVPPDPVIIPGFPPTFSWPAVDGETYVVQRATSLFPPPIVWTPIATNVAFGTTITFTDPSPPPPPVYYRIVQIP